MGQSANFVLNIHCVSNLLINIGSYSGHIVQTALPAFSARRPFLHPIPAPFFVEVDVLQTINLLLLDIYGPTTAPLTFLRVVYTIRYCAKLKGFKDQKKNYFSI